MRAYVVNEPGAPFTKVELPRPVPAANEVLVRVLASGVNPLDTKIRAGKAAHARQPLPAVLGLDMAGIVEEVGSASPGSGPATRSMEWSAVSAVIRARSPSS